MMRAGTLVVMAALGGLLLGGCAQSADEKYAISADICRKLPYAALPEDYGTPGALPDGGELESGDDGSSRCYVETNANVIVSTSFHTFATADEARADYEKKLPGGSAPRETPTVAPSSSLTPTPTLSGTPSVSPSLVLVPSPSFAVKPSASVSTSTTPAPSGSVTPSASASGSVLPSVSAGPASTIPSSLAGRVDASWLLVRDDEVLIMVVDGNLVLTVSVSAAAALDGLPGSPSDAAPYVEAVLDTLAPVTALSS